MATTIEKKLGREALLEVLCDEPRMLETYNRAARGTSLPLWSDELLAKLR